MAGKPGEAIANLPRPRARGPSPMELSVVIPALDEAENLRLLLPSLRWELERCARDFEILVVSGDAEDGTGPVCRELGAALIAQEEPGYGGALRTGFRAARGRLILTMDADFSHSPAFVAPMREAIAEADIVIASRYTPGGSADMPLSRWVLSRTLNAAFGAGLSVPVRDLSSGFRLYRADVLRGLPLASRDFDVLQEILIQGLAEGYRVREIPFRYAARRSGRSHARLLAFGRSYLKTFGRMWRLRNSIESADYDHRAYDSRIWFQRWWQRRRFSLITGFARGARRTLDVGCGSSRILAHLPGSVGLDIRQNKLRFMRRWKAGRLVRGSLFELPVRPGAFDCVVCSEVIEHVPREPALFRELARALKPGGICIVGTPDYGRRIWPLIEAVYARAIPGGYAEEHITPYTARSLREAMEGAGLRIEKSAYIFWSEFILVGRKTGGGG